MVKFSKLKRWLSSGTGRPMRCIICGRFIPWIDFERSHGATSRLAPTSPYAYEPCEDVESYCRDHAHKFVWIPELKRRLLGKVT